MIGLFRTYLMNGAPPKGMSKPFGCHDAPVLGHAMVVMTGEGRKRRIYSPCHVWSAELDSDDAEVAYAKPVPYEPARVADLVRKVAASYAALGLPGDYDAASAVLVELGEPPLDVSRAEDSPKPSGPPKSTGQVTSTSLKRPLSRGSKRGRIVALVLERDGMTLGELMAETGHSRSNVLSHLYCASRDNGVGYRLDGERVSIVLPDGLADPFEPPSHV